jgi:hypothetical protein
VPCPTTILTIGFLLAVDRSLPRLVAVIPLLWAFIGGSAAFLFGVRADLMLLAAGVALAVDLIRPRHEEKVVHLGGHRHHIHPEAITSPRVLQAKSPAGKG